MPIRDDLLRTYHTKPQITVSINNITSLCANSCDFEWLTSATPIVNSIDTTNLNSIQITGSGFDTNPLNNIILIGNIPCVVISSTATLIICAAGPNPIGTYYFNVNIVDKGSPIMNSNPSVDFQLSALTLSPKYSGTGGRL